MSNLTLETLEKMLAGFPPAPPRNDPFGLMPSRFMGMDVFEMPPQPAKIEVRDIKLSDGTSILPASFRAEMNAWFLERFGRRPEVAYMIGNWGIAMSRESIVKLTNFT